MHPPMDPRMHASSTRRPYLQELDVGHAEDGQANALDRAYEAEAAARRVETEAAAAKAKVAGLEQVLAGRVVGGREGSTG